MTRDACDPHCFECGMREAACTGEPCPVCDQPRVRHNAYAECLCPSICAVCGDDLAACPHNQETAHAA